MAHDPRFSIVIPVYNTGLYLKETLESLLGQTFKDFEAIIINDGSTDNSWEIIESIKDARFTKIDLNENKGISAARNIGLEKAQGELLAIIDSEDIADPKWLEKIDVFFITNKDVDIVGTALKVFGDSNGIVSFPEENDDIEAKMIFSNSINHPGAVVRMAAIEKSGARYDESLTSAVDYDFWRQFLTEFKFHNIQEPLVSYRRHHKQVSSAQSVKQNSNADIVRNKLIDKFFPEIGADERKVLRVLSQWEELKSENEMRAIYKLLDKLLKLNDKRARFSKASLKERAYHFWSNIFYENASASLKLWFKLTGLDLFRSLSVKTALRSRCFLRALKRSVSGGSN